MEAIRQGWLVKSPPEKRTQGRWTLFRAKWRRRYFVLYAPPAADVMPGTRAALLEYYTDEKLRRKRGAIQLADCEEVLSGLESSLYRYVLCLRAADSGRKRMYYLAADSQGDMEDWVRCLCWVLGLHEHGDDLPSISTPLLPSRASLPILPPFCRPKITYPNNNNNFSSRCTTLPSSSSSAHRVHTTSFTSPISSTNQPSSRRAAVVGHSLSLTLNSSVSSPPFQHSTLSAPNTVRPVLPLRSSSDCIITKQNKEDLTIVGCAARNDNWNDPTLVNVRNMTATPTAVNIVPLLPKDYLNGGRRAAPFSRGMSHIERSLHVVDGLSALSLVPPAPTQSSHYRNHVISSTLPRLPPAPQLPNRRPSSDNLLDGDKKGHCNYDLPRGSGTPCDDVTDDGYLSPTERLQSRNKAENRTFGITSPLSHQKVNTTAVLAPKQLPPFGSNYWLYNVPSVNYSPDVDVLYKLPILQSETTYDHPPTNQERVYSDEVYNSPPPGVRVSGGGSSVDCGDGKRQSGASSCSGGSGRGGGGGCSWDSGVGDDGFVGGFSLCEGLNKNESVYSLPRNHSLETTVETAPGAHNCNETEWTCRSFQESDSVSTESSLATKECKQAPDSISETRRMLGKNSVVGPIFETIPNSHLLNMSPPVPAAGAVRIHNYMNAGTEKVVITKPVAQPMTPHCRPSPASDLAACDNNPSSLPKISGSYDNLMMTPESFMTSTSAAEPADSSEPIRYTQRSKSFKRKVAPAVQKRTPIPVQPMRRTSVETEESSESDDNARNTDDHLLPKCIQYGNHHVKPKITDIIPCPSTHSRIAKDSQLHLSNNTQKTSSLKYLDLDLDSPNNAQIINERNGSEQSSAIYYFDGQLINGGGSGVGFGATDYKEIDWCRTKALIEMRNDVENKRRGSEHHSVETERPGK